MPLRVLDVPLDAPVPKPRESSSGGYSNHNSDGMTDETRTECDAAMKYVEEHNLGQLVGDMLSACLKERPKRPRAFVLQYLTSRLSTTELHSIGLFPKSVLHEKRKTAAYRDTSRQAALIAKLEKDMADEKAIQCVQIELDLKPEDVTKYRQVFELVDEDNSGLVGVSEFRKALAMCGYSPNQRTLMATYKAVDLDGSGQVDFLEFIRLMRAVDPDQAKKRALEMGIKEGELEKLREAWKQVDEEGTGSLSLQEMRTLVEMLGLPAGKSFTARFKEVAFNSDESGALGGDLIGNAEPKKDAPEAPASPKTQQAEIDSKVHEDEQLDFEEFLKVVQGLDSLEESRACAEAGFSESDKEAAKACFKQRDPQGTFSLSFERACFAVSTLLTMYMGVEQSTMAMASQEDMRNLFNICDSDKSTEHDSVEFIRFAGKVREMLKIREDAEARRRAKEEAEFQLTEDEIANYKEMFNKYDKKGRGALQKEAIGHLIKDLGFKATTVQERESFRRILEEVDKDGNGVIDFQEFLRLLPALMKKKEEEQQKADLAKALELGFSEQEHNEFTKVFQDFDDDKSGSLEINEVWGLLKALRRNTSYDDLKSLFARLDQDGSGSIEYNEFLVLVRELESSL